MIWKSWFRMSPISSTFQKLILKIHHFWRLNKNWFMCSGLLRCNASGKIIYNRCLMLQMINFLGRGKCLESSISREVDLKFIRNSRLRKFVTKIKYFILWYNMPTKKLIYLVKQQYAGSSTDGSPLETKLFEKVQFQVTSLTVTLREF